MVEGLTRNKSGSRRHVVQRGRSDDTHYHWFRGRGATKGPTRVQMVPAQAVRDYVIQGWAPQGPLITPDTQITAFGSCFAANISNWLSARKFRVLTRNDDPKPAYIVSCGEGMMNSFVIRQQFEWAWEGRVFDQPLWHGYDAQAFGYDPEVQAKTRAIFDATDVFILTFGLSEVWYDEPTGQVFWRAVPRAAHDPKRHKFRVSTVAENRENIEAIYALIRRHRPDARVILTLSPIPLAATFRDVGCLSANSVSKSILRVAIDEVVRAHRDEGVVHYWPAYEMITDVFRLPYLPDRRHPHRAVIDYVMTQFEHVWCAGAPETRPPLTDAWVRALAASGTLPAALVGIVDRRQRWRLARIIRGARLDDDPATDAALRTLLRDLRAGWNAGAPAIPVTLAQPVAVPLWRRVLSRLRHVPRGLPAEPTPSR